MRCSTIRDWSWFIPAYGERLLALIRRKSTPRVPFRVKGLLSSCRFHSTSQLCQCCNLASTLRMAHFPLLHEETNLPNGLFKLHSAYIHQCTANRFSIKLTSLDNFLFLQPITATHLQTSSGANVSLTPMNGESRNRNSTRPRIHGSIAKDRSGRHHVEPIHHSVSKVRFGVFEVDLQTEELYKSGMRVKIQNQPFKVLSLMLERPGEIVSRDEMQQRLWGGDQTTVDFDHSLGTAVNKLREALGDSADNPRFIETMARRGYRFIAPIRTDPEPPVTKPFLTASSSILMSSSTLGPLPPARQKGIRWPVALAATVIILIAVGLLVWWSAGTAKFQTPLRISQITFSGRVFLASLFRKTLLQRQRMGPVFIFNSLRMAKRCLHRR